MGTNDKPYAMLKVYLIVSFSKVKTQMTLQADFKCTINVPLNKRNLSPNVIVKWQNVSKATKSILIAMMMTKMMKFLMSLQVKLTRQVMRTLLLTFRIVMWLNSTRQHE